MCNNARAVLALADKDSIIGMLVGPDGISVLYEKFGKIPFKGKGHERSDLRLLMTKYEEWATKLCPVCRAQHVGQV